MAVDFCFATLSGDKKLLKRSALDKTADQKAELELNGKAKLSERALLRH